MPFAQVVEAYLFDGECVEKQRDAAHGWPNESEPTCRKELCDDALRHLVTSVAGGSRTGFDRSSISDCFLS
ncbi:MAG TPA: hypothetical protein VK457_00780 [Chloroflexota bacterium]|nr:hypothetical protein [Chloroflexota bacterium]